MYHMAGVDSMLFRGICMQQILSEDAAFYFMGIAPTQSV